MAYNKNRMNEQTTKSSHDECIKIYIVHIYLYCLSYSLVILFGVLVLLALRASCSYSECLDPTIGTLYIVNSGYFMEDCMTRGLYMYMYIYKKKNQKIKESLF